MNNRVFTVFTCYGHVPGESYVIKQFVTQMQLICQNHLNCWNCLHFIKSTTRMTHTVLLMGGPGLWGRFQNFSLTFYWAIFPCTILSPQWCAFLSFFKNYSLYLQSSWNLHSMRKKKTKHHSNSGKPKKILPLINMHYPRKVKLCIFFFNCEKKHPTNTDNSVLFFIINLTSFQNYQSDAHDMNTARSAEG